MKLFYFILVLILIYYLSKKKNYIESFYSSDDKQRIYSIMLRKISKVFSDLNIPFFLSSGTCLGYYRENKFIDYDYDIDIGVFYEDYTPKILDKLKEYGFKIYRFSGNIDDGCEFSFYYPNTIIGKKAKLDLFIHYKNENKIYWTAFAKKKNNMKIKYQVPRFTLKEADFMGVPVYIPSPTREYIESHYGKDWYKPKKPGIDYHFYESPTSIVK